MTTQLNWDQLEEADWLFRKMVRKFVKERDKITIEGVSLPGMLILHQIIREGEQRLGDLAEQLDFTSGAITALCDKLEEGGYTIRRRKKDDRRTVLLDITEKGREMFLRHQNIGSRCITLLFDHFTEAQLSEQIRHYRQIIDNLEHFSRTILELSHENADKDPAAQAEGNLENKPLKRNFLTY